MNLSVKITATWQGSDPVPPSVEIIETGQATAQGSATIGYGTTSLSANDGLESSPAGSGIAQTPTTVPPAHLTVEFGSTWSITRTFSATASASVSLPATAQGYGGCSCDSTLNSYTLQIHAQPYNFRRTYFSNETPPKSVVATAGELQFHYSWSSTSGNQADLSGIEIHENVDAPSSPSVTVNGVTGYAPPPPFGWSPSFHFDSVAVNASSTLGISDDHMWGNGVAALADCFAVPYQANSFALTQTYKFHDPTTTASGVEQLIPGASGPLTIADAVVADPKSASGYSFVVTKSGVSSLPQPLP